MRTSDCIGANITKLRIAIANALLSLAEQIYRAEDLGIDILREGMNYTHSDPIVWMHDGDDDETRRTSDTVGPEDVLDMLLREHSQYDDV